MLDLLGLKLVILLSLGKSSHPLRLFFCSSWLSCYFHQPFPSFPFSPPTSLSVTTSGAFGWQPHQGLCFVLSLTICSRLVGQALLQPNVFNIPDPDGNLKNPECLDHFKKLSDMLRVIFTFREFCTKLKKPNEMKKWIESKQTEYALPSPLPLS
jgi:hypothetical protein